MDGSKPRHLACILKLFHNLKKTQQSKFGNVEAEAFCINNKKNIKIKNTKKLT